MTNKQKEIEKNTKKAHKDFIMEYMPYVIIIIFIVIIRTFIATPIKVNGSSMAPTLKNNDIMILYKLTKKIRGIKRFDIVVVDADGSNLIKRVIGLPNDKVKYQVIKNKDEEYVATLYINGKEIEEKFIDEETRVSTCNDEYDICTEEVTLGKDEYYVMGDNRGNSTDSRLLGPIEYKKIKGTTKLTIFPFNRMGTVK